MRTPQRSLLFLLAATILSSGASFAGVIHVAWDSVPDASGYRVYYGTAPGNYTATLDAGPSTQAIVTGLEDCVDYFVAIKAYNAAGESELFSDEISGWPRPEIHSFDPSVAQQGDMFTMNIWGANFDTGATVDWTASNVPMSGQGIPLLRFDSVRVLSCNLIQAMVTVESPIRGQRAMRVGDQPVALDVENPDSVFGTATRVLDIRFNACRADINQSDDTTRDRVDGRDLSWLAYAYGTEDGGDRFNPDADLDGNGLVDGDDLAMLAPRFGQCWDGMSWGTNACQ